MGNSQVSRGRTDNVDNVSKLYYESVKTVKSEPMKGDLLFLMNLDIIYKVVDIKMYGNDKFICISSTRSALGTTGTTAIDILGTTGTTHNRKIDSCIAPECDITAIDILNPTVTIINEIEYSIIKEKYYYLMYSTSKHSSKDSIVNSSIEYIRTLYANNSLPKLTIQCLINTIAQQRKDKHNAVVKDL
jgi:hypothetical protein